MTKEKSKKGFTLLELMVVVVILAILATVAVTSYVKYMRRGKVMQAVSMLGTIKVKQEIYFTTYSRYACSMPDCSCGGFWPQEDPTISGTKLPVEVTGVTCTENASYPLAAWCQLGLNPNGEYYFKYFFEGWNGKSDAAVSECGDVPLCNPSSGSSNCFPLDTSKPWWFAIAHGNLDGDPHNILSTFFISSSTNTVIKINELN